VVSTLTMCVVARKFSSAVTLAQACLACGFFKQYLYNFTFRLKWFVIMINISVN
jgi:hypothetical protein